MCGICGVIDNSSRPQREALVKKMCHVLKHRGPDDEGIYSSGPITLGFRRLSIIDIEGGRQPMCNEDSSIWIVFNGEIYNFMELRDDLEKKGHRFRTRSDTESIIHLYEEKGVDCLESLHGMFAFAIWDEKMKLLFLARDRVGKKPLSYYHDEKKFIFASEIKAILQDQSIPRRVNKNAIEYYLAYLYIPAPMSMFEGIRKLEPAHYLIYEDGKVTTTRYWRPRLTVCPQQDLKDRIFKTLAESVSKRLISDVPLGTFLSGGIDSSIATGLASLFSKDPLRTFSIGFEETEYNELPYARITAGQFKTRHNEFTVRPSALEVLDKLVWHYDEPFGDSSSVPTYYLSKMTSSHVKVAISGDGGDECFGGYLRHLAIKKLAMIKKLPKELFKILFHILPLEDTFKATRYLKRILRLMNIMEQPLSNLYAELCCYFPEVLRKKVLNDELKLDSAVNNFISNVFEENYPDKINMAGYTDLLTYIPFDILTKVDIASMANSLEVRCPFLDHRVIELAFSIPGDLKFRKGRTKYILKETFRDFLPAQIYNRGKMGFVLPIKQWFKNELYELLNDTLLNSCSLKNYFKISEVKKLIDEHMRQNIDHADKLWALLNLDLWHRKFIEASVVTL